MNNAKIKILLIEDNSDDAALVNRLLKSNDTGNVEINWVQTVADAEASMLESQFDLVLTDLGLPDSNGIETLVQLRKINSLIPIIALTGQETDLGVDAIRAGANDYIPKDSVSKPIISRAIGYTLERSRMIRCLKEANESLERKNEHLGQMYRMSQQFVDNVSHEFRTPLTVIREFGAIIRDGIDGPVTDEQHTRLTTLISRTDDLAMMVDDLLDTSRLEAGLLRVCRQEHQLTSIVNQVQRMLKPRAESKRIDLVVKPISDQVSIYCDEEKLRRVLINLIVNAIKFTPIEGQIEVSAEQYDRDRIRITVADNGPGIPKDDLARIFDRFQRVEAHHRMASCKGFGLGLSIARALASLNLGCLQVASKEGLGCQFSVLVPVADLDSVLRCYLEQRESSIADNPEISLLEISPSSFDDKDKFDILETIDDFLRSSVKSFDLVLQVDESRWRVYSCTGENSLPAFTSNLQEEWKKLRRNHYGSTLPELQLDIKATVDIVAGRAGLLSHSTGSNEPTTSEPTGSDNKHILVVDDEHDVATAIEARLNANGFDVSLADDGLKGLTAAQTLSPDAILLDIRMPKLDGLSVLNRLKSNPATAETPVIVLSASLSDKQVVLDSGANFFLQKPFQSTAILAALESALTQSENK